MKKGLWLSVGGEHLADSVQINIEKSGQFTTPVVARDVRPQAAELAIVSIHGTEADYLAISQKGRRVATGQITLAFSKFVPLDALRIQAIRSNLPSKFRDRFDPPKNGPWRPTPRLWEEVLKATSVLRPNTAGKLQELRSIIASSQDSRSRREGGLEVFERDAVASAIQTWGGDSRRKSVLRAAEPSHATPVAPFLSQLTSVSLREDPQISHDHITFPGMEIARKDMVGSIVLRDAYSEEYLTILNCNRQPLEETLGVDLIYYNHRFDSFVLVQYKRMTEDPSGTLCYRPGSDKNLEKEIARMQEAELAMVKLPPPAVATAKVFRLLEQPFYIKLCESKATSALDVGMVSGMYIPLELWRLELNSPETRGPRGGIVMSWDTCSRRLSNGEFTRLLRQGWIGSAAGRSAYLSQIIEDVLGSRRSLILAATSPGPASRDYRRDGMGRFADADDPEAAF